MTVNTPDTPEPVPHFECFRLVYPSGTVIESYYPGGATLREVQVTHPLAAVEVVEAVEEGT
ncbi:MAG: hypothetical protein M3461_18820 [Pseudomonadota bacterium]|nr:hypothetical protein [Pseudomonadota bacterium]